MDVKYTIEILTKDIQEIEKLVASLQNSPDGSTLELDLALSKLRNVYDVLTMIRSDRMPGSRPAAVPDPSPRTVQESSPPAREEERPPSAPPPEGSTPAAPQEPEAVAVKKAGTVGESFGTASGINENLSPKRSGARSGNLVGQPIDSISRNIGINDRFLIIRELFDGDGERFRRLIEHLDSAGQLSEAMERLSSHFGELPEHEGIAILQTLIKRRYPSR